MPGASKTRSPRYARLVVAMDPTTFDTALLHRRQFVIAPGPRLIKPDWRAYELTNGLVLSACPEAPVRRVDDRDGKTWTIIGHAFQTAPGEAQPAGQIVALKSVSVVAATYEWAGRWLLIGPEVVVPDACGLLGMFYLDPAAGGEFLASSSLAVMKHLMPELGEDPRRLHWHGISWYVMPSSRLDGVKKLLPDQILSLRTRSVAYVKRTFPERYESMNTDERALALLAKLGRVLADLSTEGRRISLALSSGIDSRSTLAAAVAAGVRVEAVTMQHPRISEADRVVPPAICRSLGIKHTYLRPRALDRRWRALYQAHTLGDSVGADAYFFAHHVFDRLGGTTWLVRSAPWTIAKAAWYEWFDGVSWDDLRDRPENFLWKKRTFSSVRRSAEALREYVAWRDKHPEPHDWRDTWPRDQSEAGGASAIEQSLDLIECSSVVAVNCSALYDIMLSEPEESRRNRALQMRILELSGTGLESVPINPSLDLPLVTAVRKGTWHAANIALETRNIVAGSLTTRGRAARRTSY